MAHKAKKVDATAKAGEEKASVTAAAQPQQNNNTTKSDAKAKEHTFTDAQRMLFETQEKVIASNVGAFLVLGEALHIIKAGGLHYISHPSLTYEEYCAKKWGFGQAYAYRLIAAYLCVQHLKTALTPNKVTVFPMNESQVRPIAGLKQDEQVKVWSAVLEKANGQIVTAKLVEECAGSGSTSEGAETATSEPTDAKAQKAEAKANSRKLAQIIKVIGKIKKVPDNELSLKLLQDIIAKIEKVLSDSQE